MIPRPPADLCSPNLSELAGAEGFSEDFHGYLAEMDKAGLEDQGLSPTLTRGEVNVWEHNVAALMSLGESSPASATAMTKYALVQRLVAACVHANEHPYAPDIDARIALVEEELRDIEAEIARVTRLTETWPLIDHLEQQLDSAL